MNNEKNREHEKKIKEAMKKHNLVEVNAGVAK